MKLKSILAVGFGLILGTQAPLLANPEPQFRLSAVETSASAYLDARAVEKVTGGYIDRPITFADLQNLVSDLKALYVEAGVPTADVILPPQELVGGKLRVDLIEAEIESLDFTGNETTDPDFLRQNLALSLGQKPDFVQIERDLRSFGMNHDIVPTLDFSPGKEHGGTAVTVAVVEPKRLQFGVSLDNQGRKETGEARLGVNALWSSVSGWRDRLAFNIIGAQSAWSGSLTYDRPMWRQGGRGFFSVYKSNSQVTGGSFIDANIVSDGRGVVLGYRAPVTLEFDRSLFASVSLTQDETNSQIAGIEFADTTVRELTSELNWRRSFALSEVGITGRLRLGSASSVGGALSDGGYGILQLNGWANRQVSQNWALSVNFDIQVANKRQLPVSRHFAVGGVTTLRGYPMDVRTAPEGMALQLQTSRVTPLSWRDGDIAVQPFAFLDLAILATSRTIGARISAEDRLASIGGGANFVFYQDYSMQALLGVPLRATPGLSAPRRPNLYLGLNAKF